MRPVRSPAIIPVSFPRTANPTGNTPALPPRHPPRPPPPRPPLPHPASPPSRFAALRCRAASSPPFRLFASAGTSSSLLYPLRPSAATPRYAAAPLRPRCRAAAVPSLRRAAPCAFALEGICGIVACISRHRLPLGGLGRNLRKCCTPLSLFCRSAVVAYRFCGSAASPGALIQHFCKKRPNPAFAGMMRWPAKRHIRQATWVVCRLWGNHANLPLVHCAMRRWGGARGDKKWRWRK